MTYLRQGYELVKDIREIIQLTDNDEAEGMAAVYEADYQMLLGLGIAQRTYREAMELFVEAGIDKEKIVDFFTRPLFVPFFSCHHVVPIMSFPSCRSNKVLT